MTVRYQRDHDGHLTSNGRRDAQLDALALIEAEIEYRRDSMRNLFDASEGDLRALAEQLAIVAAKALRERGREPLAALRSVRLQSVDEG